MPPVLNVCMCSHSAQRGGDADAVDDEGIVDFVACSKGVWGRRLAAGSKLRVAKKPEKTPEKLSPMHAFGYNT